MCAYVHVNSDCRVSTVESAEESVECAECAPVHCSVHITHTYILYIYLSLIALSAHDDARVNTHKCKSKIQNPHKTETIQFRCAVGTMVAACRCLP